MSERYVFTSESVSEGHPDKMADQISDAVLDAILAQDKHARVACETMVKTGMALLGGEITTSAWVDMEDVVRQTVKEIGYDDPAMGFDWEACAVITAISKQSPDIAMGVDEGENKEMGAGDQGLMFGYATNETDAFMPAPIYYAHRLMQRQAELRKKKILPWLRPDAKSQVTLVYEDGRPIAVDAVVLSTQHDPDISQSDLHEAVREEIIRHVLPEEWLTPETKYFINPTGRFVIGGPVGDCGLTGRKIIVDFRPIYRKTAAYGHFGRDEPEFTWERTDKAQALRQAAGLRLTAQAGPRPARSVAAGRPVRLAGPGETIQRRSICYHGD